MLLMKKTMLLMKKTLLLMKKTLMKKTLMKKTLLLMRKMLLMKKMMVVRKKLMLKFQNIVPVFTIRRNVRIPVVTSKLRSVMHGYSVFSFLPECQIPKIGN